MLRGRAAFPAEKPSAPAEIDVTAVITRYFSKNKSSGPVSQIGTQVRMIFQQTAIQEYA